MYVSIDKTFLVDVFAQLSIKFWDQFFPCHITRHLIKKPVLNEFQVFQWKLLSENLKIHVSICGFSLT